MYMKTFILIAFILTKSILFAQDINTNSIKKYNTSIYAIHIIQNVNPSTAIPRLKFSFEFNQLKSTDTLIIASTIMDCGEFGGHNEYIYIYLLDSKIYAKLKRDKLCDAESLKNNPKATFTEIVELQPNSQKTILDYINDFNVYVPEANVSSNAQTDFWIQFKNENYDLHDQTGRWKQFLIIRNRLFIKE